MARKFFIPILSFALFFAFGTTLIFAQGNVSNQPGNISNQPGNVSNPPGNVSNPSNCPVGTTFCLENPFAVGDTLFQLLETVVNRIILPIGGMLAVLAFIYSGFLYVTAQGKPTALEKANKALLYTAIGTAVLLGSWALANVIRGTINQLI